MSTRSFSSQQEVTSTLDLDEPLSLADPHFQRREFSMAVHSVKSFLRGFQALHFFGPCVSVFGPARLNQGDVYYALPREVGKHLSHLGFTVMIGEVRECVIYYIARSERVTTMAMSVPRAASVFPHPTVAGERRECRPRMVTPA
jgi:hypothetical protein